MLSREEATRTFRRSRPAGPIGVVVRVVNRPAAPQLLRLLEGACVVGAGRDVDLVVDDETVSRRHLELSLVPEGVAVRDLGSHNGTYYLGHRVEKAVLAIGSTLQLGRAQIRFTPDEESLELESPEGRARYGELVGSSPAMRKVFGLLSRLESSLVNVLVEGESGTGKELVARAIHAHSPAAAGPFVALNCGAMDRALARSELFGHRRGAFTGASEARTGAFEAASGGTLFLDEVGELPYDVQPLLLRALEAGAITRMGDNDEHPVKVRIIAATNRDLAGQVRAGNFRDDLYFRLAVVRIALPPLRDRPEDIAQLARRFAQEIGLAELGEDVSTELGRRLWPGNARELRNAIHAYAVLGSVPEHRSEREEVLDDALVSSVDLEIPYAAQKDRILKRFLHVYLKTLLTHTKGNQSLAAKISGLQRSYVNKIVNEVNLTTAGSRPEDAE